MKMYDLIEKKKRGGALTAEEISYMIRNYVKGEIPDYQMAAMLMAICFQGMDDREITELTMEMARSGDMVDLSAISGIKVDKHSTGGVGDKTTLIIGPVVASLGVPVAKMSGRGLGHTGGTVDKLESIPGFRTNLSMQEFFDAVNRTSLCVIGQTADLAPADKRMYALRDVTATVDSIPLIASSVMSKKLAAGSNRIVLDVTCGSGAFMKKKEDAAELAEKMVAIGINAGRPTTALITDMDVPLGNTIGNSLEVEEAIEVLKGKGPSDLREICIHLAGEMLSLAGLGTREECLEKAICSLDNGLALKKFRDMLAGQGGDPSVTETNGPFLQAQYHYELVANQSGRILHMDTEKCGLASAALGAGRRTAKDSIDAAAGIRLFKKTGDAVSLGETLAVLYSSNAGGFQEAEGLFREALTIGEGEPVKEKPVLARVSEEGTVWY